MRQCRTKPSRLNPKLSTPGGGSEEMRGKQDRGKAGGAARGDTGGDDMTQQKEAEGGASEQRGGEGGKGEQGRSVGELVTSAPKPVPQTSGVACGPASPMLYTLNRSLDPDP